MNLRTKVILPLASGGLLALIPPPEGLAINAWFYFCVFVTVILALITEPIPAAGAGLLAVVFISITGIIFSPDQWSDPSFQPTKASLKWALSGFSNGTVWLIFGAFMFSMGYEKTGLGRRIALLLVRRLGKNTLGLGYAVMMADLFLAPFTPSNTARSAGTIFPIIRSIPGLYGSNAEESPRRIGAYIMWTALATTCVTSSMFLTALAPNLFVLELLKEIAGVELTWMQWFIGFLPVGIPLVIILPLLIYWIYPPEIKVSPEVPDWAKNELKKMGNMKPREYTMAGLVLLALSLWIFGGDFIGATMVALLVISLMLITHVVTWDDVIGYKSAWNVLAWFATLVVLADGLNQVGFIGWFGGYAASYLTGFSPTVVMLALVCLFFLIHYFFASLAAHAAAVLPVILAAGIATPGMNIPAFSMLLAYSLGLMGIITPYATGPGPAYYNSGYISRNAFWTLGLFFGLFYLLALLLIGMPWLS